MRCRPTKTRASAQRIHSFDRGARLHFEGAPTFGADHSTLMQFDKLFRLLLRNDVKELALQADRPPCALVNDAYTPVVPRNFSEEEVIATLVEAGGQAQVLGLVDTPRRWEFDHPTIGRVRVSAGYHDGVLPIPEASQAANLAAMLRT